MQLRRLPLTQWAVIRGYSKLSAHVLFLVVLWDPYCAGYVIGNVCVQSKHLRSCTIFQHGSTMTLTLITLLLFVVITLSTQAEECIIQINTCRISATVTTLTRMMFA